MLLPELTENDRDFFQIKDLSDEEYKQTFYCAIKPAMHVAKIFGLFPISIRSKQPREIKFKWRSYRTIISLVFIAWCMLTTVCILKTKIEQEPLTASNIVEVIFFGICGIIAIAFFRISMRFRRLMIFWLNVEQVLLHEKYALPASRWSLRTRIVVFLCVFLCCSFSEHALSLGALFYKMQFELSYCNYTDYDLLGTFIQKHLKYVLDTVPLEYNNVLGIVVEYFNFSNTFFWNYLDLFIILLSMGLSDLFERIAHRIESLQTVKLNEDVWGELRMDYVQVSELIRVVNEELGFIFMLACLNDTYFILIQMLNITTSLPFAVSIVYFWFSLIYLVTRSTLMVAYASDIYDNARKPLEVIVAAPVDQWGPELQRFFNQIKYHSNALSGKNFFIITRTLLFSMAGILVTYELVLLQVDGKPVDWQDLVDCNSLT